MPCILKDAHGGGWRDVYVCSSIEELIDFYDESGKLTMVVQEYIKWDQFVRCLCIGQENILPIKYDPKQRKYHVEHEHLSPEVGARVVDDALRRNPPVFLDGKVGHPEAILLEPLARVQDRLVLSLRRDDVAPTILVEPRGALDGQIVRLGRAGGPDELLRVALDERGDLLHASALPVHGRAIAENQPLALRCGDTLTHLALRYAGHRRQLRRRQAWVPLEQLQKLGSSCDWERTRFTMDGVEGDAAIDFRTEGSGGGSTFMRLRETSNTPPNGAGDAMHLYFKDDKLIIQFNDGGTIRYKYLDLTGTGVTWQHSTSAP